MINDYPSVPAICIQMVGIRDQEIVLWKVGIVVGPFIFNNRFEIVEESSGSNSVYIIIEWK